MDVQIDDYLTMIAHKTSVLLGCSLYCGAISAGASEQNALLLYEAGLKLGISFQIQDDILDTYGDSSTFGKKVGGDIIQNKKTFLFLAARDSADEADTLALQALFASQPEDASQKIAQVKSLYDKYQVRETASAVMARFYEEARAALGHVDAAPERLAPLFSLMEQVYERKM
jgi:geranylgeranyl diphosphate synthase type II